MLVEDSSCVQIRLPTPSPWKRYRLGDSLSQSIYGEVRLGYDTYTDKIVAVKLSHQHLLNAKPSALVEDPVNETRIMAKLCLQGGHPNVVNLIDTFEDGEVLTTILEFAAHGELFDYVTRQTKLPLETAKKFGRQISSGVDFIHNSGIAHLDISLENVLLANLPGTEELVCKICDFGLATMNPHKRPPSAGKIAYMAPEIFDPALQPQNYDSRSADIWAIGVCLFTMLTGFAPLEAPNSTDPRYSLIMAKNDSNGGVAGLLKAWNIQVPPLALDLLEKTLCYTEQRLTIEQVVKHPFLAP